MNGARLVVVWGMFAGLSGCSSEPDWLDGCSKCGPEQICDGGSCSAVPEACSAGFSGACSLDKVDDACLQALCGVDELVSYEIEAECWEDDERVYKYAYCYVY